MYRHAKLHLRGDSRHAPAVKCTSRSAGALFYFLVYSLGSRFSRLMAALRFPSTPTVLDKSAQRLRGTSYPGKRSTQPSPTLKAVGESGRIYKPDAVRASSAVSVFSASSCSLNPPWQD